MFRRGLVFQLINGLMKTLYPTRTTCLCCGSSWKLVRKHSTMYNKTDGCFPLCKVCWRKLETPTRRLPYYRQLFNIWNANSNVAHTEAEWQQIEAAVRAGR
jgi:hypothetical protein